MRLLKRTSPVRVIAATAVAGLVFAAAGAAVAWGLAQQRLEAQRTEWLRQQSNPRLAALLMSEEGRAGVRLAETGVARLLAKCNGRGSWRVQDGYCVPMRPDGRPGRLQAKQGGGMTTKHLPARIARGNRKHPMHSATSGEEGSITRTADDQSRRIRMGLQKQSFSTREFCDLHDISRSFFYLLREKGEAPRLMKVGRRMLVSAEAAAEWRRDMEHMAITKQKIT